VINFQKQKDIVFIYGSGGFAQELAGWFKMSKVEIFCFYSDDKAESHHTMGIPVFNDLRKIPPMKSFVGIGDPEARKKITFKLVSYGYDVGDYFFANGSINGFNNTIGSGSMICPNSVITTNCTIGSSLLLNINSTIGHNCKIGDYVTVSPGVNISGNVTIGNGAYIGTNAVIREIIKIGAGAVVCMGAVVTKDVLPGEKVVGNPARPMSVIGGEKVVSMV
jgi:sugar O-acyltransferase (sialic acid O-acetyltransferase NeuD family)